ncbi:hypothetical protein GCM10008983_18940 [Lentibacillus halophilus]|uniref:Uncharacterized protein n=1 Tax=Lentibacillus halophilus TaxID=295065 RepID=A0ABN0ZB35_9BACI
MRKEQLELCQGYFASLAKKGIATVEDDKAEEAAFRRSRQHGQRTNAARIEEVIPDWFREQKRREKLKQEREQTADESRDKTAEWEETERLLAKFSGVGNHQVSGTYHHNSFTSFPKDDFRQLPKIILILDIRPPLFDIGFLNVQIGRHNFIVSSE